MIFSPEQEAIFRREDSFCINATAGSGKTTTLCSWAQVNNDKKVLAICYNQSSMQDMRKKAQALGVVNMSVETAHGLAYKGFFSPREQQNKPQLDFNLTAAKIVEYLRIEDLPGDENSCYVLADYINSVLSFFFNSTLDFEQLLPTHFPELSQIPLFVKEFDLIRDYSKKLFEMMKSKRVAMNHDCYLKLYWELGHKLGYDAILFDEGQDASPVMLDVFLRQTHATRIIVGDEHQQIYSWRHAVNALSTVPLDKCYLTSSFRFKEGIASEANRILAWKKSLGLSFHTPPLVGVRGAYPDPFPEKTSYGIVARTNSGLLRSAIYLLSNNDPCMDSITFEGNFKSYAFGDRGFSVYDVLNCFLGDRTKINSPLIQNVGGFDQLRNYAEKTLDHNLLLQIDIVETFRKDLPRLIKAIESRLVQDKVTAETVFSTAHKSKGMEYDQVTIVNDFHSLAALKFAISNGRMSLGRAAEEINLLYVSITRSRGLINMPRSLAVDIS
ncbi:MAG: AAA family ATPase [Cytophagales bacterium]|nr:AAA family ATPase [Cytophagales bacterium]